MLLMCVWLFFPRVWPCNAKPLLFDVC